MTDYRQWLPSMPRKRWLIAAFLFIGLPMLIWRQAIVPTIQTIFPFTAQTLSIDERVAQISLVRTLVGDAQEEVLFSIPKAYLPHDYQRAGGEFKFITILAAWPDLDPWSRAHLPKLQRETNTLTYPEAPDSTRRIRIRINKGANVTRRTLMGETALDVVDDNKLSFLNRTDFGLVRYRSRRRIKDDYYVPPDRVGGPAIYISCARPPGRCRGHSDFGDQLRLTFVFHPSLLSQWPDIQSGVNALVARLIASQPE